LADRHWLLLRGIQQGILDFEFLAGNAFQVFGPTALLGADKLDLLLKKVELFEC
jgi:hypothetical protein